MARESITGGARNDGDGDGVRSVGEREKEVETKYLSLNASDGVSFACHDCGKAVTYWVPERK